MVLQGHRAILVSIDHGILPRKSRSPDRSRDEPRGTLKGVPIKVRIGNTNALRGVRLLSICTFAEIMSRENLRRAPPPGDSQHSRAWACDPRGARRPTSTSTAFLRALRVPSRYGRKQRYSAIGQHVEIILAPLA